MNEVIKTILNRRSIRSFAADRDIPRDILEQIVEAGRWAPTGRNNQLTEFTVLVNKEKMKRFASVIKSVSPQLAEGYDFYSPNVLIIVSQPETNPHRIEDCACALQNIFLAAESLKIGSVWINQAKDICNIPEVRKILDELNIPKNHNIYGMAALGYYDSQVKEVPRKFENVRWVL